MVWSEFVFFNDTATTEIYTLSLHDALPIYPFAPRATLRRGGHARRCGGSRRCRAARQAGRARAPRRRRARRTARSPRRGRRRRSEEHTSELQSRQYLVCRLLLEKKINVLHI